MTKTETVLDVIESMQHEVEQLLKSGESFGFKRQIQAGNELMYWADRLGTAWRAEHSVALADAAIHTDPDGNQYQLMTGRELIAGLADDAMQDEPLGESYGAVDTIVPGKRYRAYLDAGGSALSGEWEVEE
ncbi:hypothetical protein [Lacticaseibacillus hegangensis]|uniref:Uncharacterized protein n=1 Tax=Lacticaseibacillus hegangensis TaxID=2486010 RepID=A0ABW4CZC6_9LACO|nr:hypothetical protein [Lacticaseibacillus hegangensis]